MSLVGKTYQWGSWAITFKENDVLESVGGYTGVGTYTFNDLYNIYDINIKDTLYAIKFEKNNHKFISTRCNNGNQDEGFDHAEYPDKISLVGKTYQWGSWAITFNDNGVLESVGGYTGVGTYEFIKGYTQAYLYSLHINNTIYRIKFEKNNLYREFIFINKDDIKDQTKYVQIQK